MVSKLKQNNSFNGLDDQAYLLNNSSRSKSNLKSVKSLTSIKNKEEQTLAVVKKEKKVILKSIENIESTHKLENNANELKKSSEQSSTTSSSSTSSKFGFNYSYVVLIASFFSYMLACILSSCFGIFFENMEADLGWSKSKVAFIGGLISSLQDLTGPISSALTNQYGCRKTAFFGGLIAALGMIGSAYANEFWLLGFLMGGVSGFGTSLVLVSSVVVVTYYFEEKPSFAAGLTISGGSLGQSIFSLIIIHLNEIYGRSGCFLILGGILLNILVCACLFRPLKWELEDDDEDEDEDDEDNDEEEEDEEESIASNKPIEYKNLKADSNSLLNNLNAPCASIESLSNRLNLEKEQEDLIDFVQIPKKRYLKSTNFLNFKNVSKPYSFSSDSCIPIKQKYFNLDQIPNNLMASEISLKSNQPIDEIKPVKRLLSGLTTDSVSLSRCHSLSFKNSRSETNNLKMNSSVPTDLQSLETNLNLNLEDQDFMTESKKAALDEYVVVDAVDIANCGSNLIISSSQNAIYLPILSDGDETNLKNDESQLVDENNNLESPIIDDNFDYIDDKKQLNTELKKISSLKNLDSAQKPNQQQNQNYKNVFSNFFNKFLSKEHTQTNQNNLAQANNRNSQVLNEMKKSVQVNLNQAQHISNKKKVQNQIFINKNGQKIPHKKYIIAKCSCKQRNLQSFNKNNPYKQNQNQQSTNPTNTQNIKSLTKVRHYPNCPFYYINLNRVQSNQIASSNQHSNINHHKASLYHVPNLFQNSYRFPLHFRNVYYYKSLLNLNMRIMVLRPHGAGALTVNAPANINNISLSCPDLNLKQILIVKRNQASNNQDSKTSYPVLTIKDLKSAKRQIDIENLKSCSGAQVLNAGSILLLTNTGSTNKIRRDSFINRKINEDKTKVIKINENKHLDLKRFLKKKEDYKFSDFNLNDYDDKINDESEDDNDSEEDTDDEDDDDDEEDSDEEEDCDNCFTRSKYGNAIYKYLYKPLVKPFKFIYYSIAENIKLFRLFKFCIFAFCNFILSFFYEAPFYFINSFMTENGLTKSQGGTVTVAVGIVSVFSTIVYGYIGDSKRVNSIILYSGSLIICGICCCAIPTFITNYAITMTLMILIGALISVSDVLVPIICVNIVGYDDFVNAYGLMFFCQGLASFSGPPILGIVADKSGNYALSYYIIGIGICLSGLVLCTILCYDKVEKRNKNNLKQIEKV